MDSIHDLPLEKTSNPIPSRMAMRYDGAVISEWPRIDMGNLYDFNRMDIDVPLAVGRWHVM
jgi:hypothetical protein